MSNFYEETEQDSLYRLFAQVPMPLSFLMGPEHIFTLVNPATQQLVPDRVLLGKTFREALPEFEEQGFFGIMDRVYESGEPYFATELPVFLDRPDGTREELFFNFMYQPVRDREGKIEGILQVGFEVTALVRTRRQVERFAGDLQAERQRLQEVLAAEQEARKEVEETWQQAAQGLLRTNRLLTDLIELAHDAILVRDSQSRIVFWNQGAEQLYGWRSDEVLGQITHVLLATRFPDSEEAVERQLLEQGRWEGVLTHRRSDGMPIIVESRQVLVCNEAGEPEAVLEINRDITEQERLLEERAQAQARELAAHEARERMDAFLGMASHELRTPLAAIKGNLQLSRRRLNAMMKQTQAEAVRLSQQFADLQLLLERAERQVGVQNRLVGDLLDVSRIQTGHLDLHLERQNLTEIVREVVEDQRVAAAPRVIHLELPDAREVPVMADAGRIEQVVSNYVTNAVKYSPLERPIVVRLEVEEEMAQLSVQDEGPGLAPEEKELIWERFYRGTGNERQHVSGTSLGLGLYICRTIIHQHGGQVGVTSTEGQGSTFWFTLPLATSTSE